MEQKITTIYNEYRQGQTNRRDFIRKLAMVAGSTAAALALLPVLEENSLKASASLQDDADLVTEFITYPGATGDMKAFLARPKSGRKFPAVIVIHENRGLVPHIRDVTRRLFGNCT
jgi:carboxymethylenebutenolidase